MLLIDFDGTMYQGTYIDRFTATDPPCLDTVRRINQYRDAYGGDVVVFTARIADCNAGQSTRIVRAIQDWTAEHFDGWRPDVTATKYPGVIIDNHAFGFRGRWPSVEMLMQIHDGKPFMSSEKYDEQKRSLTI